MRQLWPGAGDSGHFFSYIIAFLWIFSTVSFADTMTPPRSPPVEDPEPSSSSSSGSRGRPGSSSGGTTETHKEVAVIVPRDSDVIPSYARNRKRSMVGNYLGQHRNLNDYEIEDFVLLATVDGTLSARDRKTGKERWQIHTEDGAVQTVNHKANSSSVTGVHSGEAAQDEMVTWIVEPTEDGELLLFLSPEGGLEKLGITVKEIIHSTPYRPPGVDTVFNGAKTTTTYAIDARTGDIQRVFSTGDVSGVVNDKKCKTTTKLSDLGDECDTSEESSKIIMLGRTEYTIRIRSWLTAELLWTIKFNEWSPNHSDGDLRAQHQRPKDNRYIYSQYDGTIYGFDDADASGLKQPKYHATLESPVVRIFDVVRPLITDSDDLLVLPQPFVRSKRDDEVNKEDSTFVGCTQNGGWFALSEANFPYVTRQASDANCYKNAPLWKSLPASEREKLLVGVHKVQVSVQGVHRQSLPAPPRYESDTRNAHNGNDSPAASQSSIARVPSTFLKEAGHTSLVVSIGLFLLSVFFVVSPGTVRGYYKSISGKHGDMSLDYPGSLTTPPRAPVVRQLPSEASEAPPAPSTAITVEIPEVKEPKEEEPESEETKVEEPEPEEIIVEEPKADVPKAPTVRFEEPIPEPAKEPTPETGPEDSKDDVETASEAAPPTPKKKKYQRGRRGGKKKKLNVETESNAAPEDADKGVQGRKEKLHNITVVSSGKVEEDVPGSPFILNSLEVYEDEVIGAGSQGTTVHKGNWEGKLVAVKRILTTYADVAMKEVHTLQAADYHENVVRYYCQQQRGSFLYIALELCPGSLYDVVTKPHMFEELVNYMDPRDTLYQITHGLHHLHTLKIVHRDIKPQNILVGAPNFRSTRPRLLISDFGLCKKLQSDEYSFGATTAQHAGTVGWRAPELLQDAVSLASGFPQPNENSGSGTGSASTDIVVDPLTKRRATRAIDIFALGCVCYFVLSRGQHPFGERFSRELNIVRGNSDLSQILVLKDAGHEAADLISSMIRSDPKQRPDTAKVGIHPFFWNAEKRLDFLLTVSDRFELEKDKEKNDKTYASPYIPILEEGAPDVVGPSWFKSLDKHMYNELFQTKRRGYDGAKILDLLRAIRNKKHHFLDMNLDAQRSVGEPPDAYLQYFTERFEHLLMYSYTVIAQTGFNEETRFRKFFSSPW